MELVPRNNCEGHVEALCFLLECDLAIFHADHRSDNVSFANLKACILSIIYLDLVVKFYVVVRPGAPVSANHVPAVPQRAEIELI